MPACDAIATPQMSDLEHTGPSRPTPSRQVVEACQRGDMSAFHELFEIYGGRVHSIARAFSGDESVAKDITQRVFLKLFTCIAQFRRDADFATWLYRIVVNECLDERRKRSRFIFLERLTDVPHPPAKASPEKQMLRMQITDEVQAAIAKIQPKLRLPILLRYVEGLSYEEIAAALGCSKGTVASRLNRGHKLLAEKLAHLRHTLEEMQ